MSVNKKRLSQACVATSAIIIAMTGGRVIASNHVAQETRTTTASTLQVAPPPAAQQVAGNQSPPDATSTPKPETQPMVCRVQTSLGSRLGKRRVCRTAAEWELMRRDARDAVDSRQRMNSGGRSKGDGG